MKKKHPVLVFYFFLFLLTVSLILPLHFFWLYFLLAVIIVFSLRIPLRHLFRKTFLYLLAGNLTLFFYFYADAWLFRQAVAPDQQVWIVVNVYVRMASSLFAVLVYRESASLRDLLFVLNRHRLPVKLILLLMISLNMIRLFSRDIIIFAQHYRLRIYRGPRMRYMVPWTKTLLMIYFRQAELYAQTLCLQNLHSNPSVIRAIFHDPV